MLAHGAHDKSTKDKSNYQHHCRVSPQGAAVNYPNDAATVVAIQPQKTDGAMARPVIVVCSGLDGRVDCAGDGHGGDDDDIVHRPVPP